MSERRGLDGLTAGMLRASRASWWDDAFTRRLLGLVPGEAARIVDVGCGLARAAHALLPGLPSASYVGIDADEERVDEARAETASAAFGSRVELRVGRAEALPVESASADVVLTVMTLQHLPDVPAALREAGRVLRAWGRMIAAEPDNLGQRFYLDGPLDELTAAVRALCARARMVRRPADLAIGPRVARLLMEAGFADVTGAVHAVQVTRVELPRNFVDRVRRIVRAIADQARLGGEASEVVACERAIEGALVSAGECEVLASHVVPVFVCAGTWPPNGHPAGAGGAPAR